MIPPRFHGDRGLETFSLHDQHMLDARRVRDGFVRDGFQSEDLAAPIATVGRDHQLGLGIVDAIAQRLRAEPSKDDAVNGAIRAQASMATGSSGIIGR